MYILNLFQSSVACHIETSHLICSENNLICSENQMNGFLIKCNTGLKWVKPFHATGLFLYLLKTSENQTASDVLRGYRKRPLA